MFQSVTDAANNLSATQAILMFAVYWGVHFAALRFPALSFLLPYLPKPSSPVGTSPAPAPQILPAASSEPAPSVKPLDAAVASLSAALDKQQQENEKAFAAKIVAAAGAPA